MLLTVKTVNGEDGSKSYDGLRSFLPELQYQQKQSWQRH